MIHAKFSLEQNSLFSVDRCQVLVVTIVKITPEQCARQASRMISPMPSRSQNWPATKIERTKPQNPALAIQPRCSCVSWNCSPKSPMISPRIANVRPLTTNARQLPAAASSSGFGPPGHPADTCRPRKPSITQPRRKPLSVVVPGPCRGAGQRTFESHAPCSGRLV